MSLSSALERLATYRTNNTRASQDTFEKGSQVLKAGSTPNLGDEGSLPDPTAKTTSLNTTSTGWAFLEQLALASIDVGRLDITDLCLKQLGAKFAKSPRVDVLTGIRMEATESAGVVLQYYDELLDADPTNVAAWKRRISVIRRIGRYEKAVEELSQYLDTFYTDLEGWLELADIYCVCSQYTSALQALSHALVLAPQNPFTVLQFAETAYTAGDLPLALKMFLLVVDMGERDLGDNDSPVGINIRGWFGVKLCSRQLVVLPNSPSASNTPIPKTLKKIDELATERVLTAYRGNRDAGARQVSDWMTR